MKKSLTILLLICSVFQTKGQNIKNVIFDVIDDKIEVTFDVVGKKDQVFNLEVVLELNHQRYYPQEIYGKTQNVKPARGLKLTLMPLRENFEIDGNLRVGVKAIPVFNLNEYTTFKTTGYYPEHIIKSAVFAGWGHFNTNGKISNLSGVAISTLYATCITGIVYNRIAYKANYSRYQSATHQNDIDFWYNKANPQYRSFQGFIWTGILILGLDLWYVNTKVKSDAQHRDRNQSSVTQPNLILTATPNQLQLGYQFKF